MLIKVSYNVCRSLCISVLIVYVGVVCIHGNLKSILFTQKKRETTPGNILHLLILLFPLLLFLLLLLLLIIIDNKNNNK